MPRTKWPYVMKLDECEVTIGPVRNGDQIVVPVAPRIRCEVTLTTIGGEHSALITLRPGSTTAYNTHRLIVGQEYWGTVKYSI